MLFAEEKLQLASHMHLCDSATGLRSTLTKLSQTILNLIFRTVTFGLSCYHLYASC